jgi:bifunctional non-homologous end joining protein LigD
MPAGPRPYTLYTAIPGDLAMPLAHAPDTGNTVIAEPARVVFPDAGFTRADVAGYYRRVAPQLLADIAGRPLSLLRCPDGLAGECFFQRHPEPGWDATVHRFEPASENGRPATCVYIDDVRGLLELVRLGVLELHVWGSTARMPDRPERAVFDLDPGEGVAWQVVGAAREIRAALARRGLRSFVRLTGGKGVHVVLPFAPAPTGRR